MCNFGLVFSRNFHHNIIMYIRSSLFVIRTYVLSNTRSSATDPEQLKRTLDAILTDHAPHPLASVRQSACVWLLSILKHSSAHPDMKVSITIL